jgi:hypothetical protein
MDVVSDLLVSSIKESMAQEAINDSTNDWKDFEISPATAAAEALECLLITKVQNFIHNTRLGHINGKRIENILFHKIFLCTHVIIVSQICGDCFTHHLMHKEK